MNTGMTMSGINFDTSALQAIDEEELRREEQAQQDELKDFLSKQLGDFVDSELDSASDGGQTGANSDGDDERDSYIASDSDSSSCSRSRSLATHSDSDSSSTCSSASRSTPTPKQPPPTQLDAAIAGELAFDPNTGLPLSFNPTLSGMHPFGVSPMHPLFQPSSDLLARLGIPLNAGTMFNPHTAADSLAVAAAFGLNPLALGAYPLPVGVLPFLTPPQQPAGVGLAASSPDSGIALPSNNTANTSGGSASTTTAKQQSVTATRSHSSGTGSTSSLKSDSSLPYDAAKLEMLYKARGRRINELGREMERLRDEQKRELFAVRHKLTLVEADRDGARASLEQTQALLGVARDTVAALERRVRELETSLARALESSQRNAEAERLARAQAEELNARVTELSNSTMLSKLKQQQAAIIGSVRAQHSDVIIIDDLEKRLQDTETTLQSRDEEIDRWRVKYETALSEKLNTMQQLACTQTQTPCEQLLDSSAMQELAKLGSTIQQMEAAKRMTDQVHAAVQDELRELKEQLTLYESAARCGVTLASVNDSDACQIDSVALPQSPAGYSPNVTATSPISNTTLRTEFERCLAAYRQKRIQLARVNDEVYNARKEVGELRKRIDRFEELAREQQAEIERLHPLVNETRFNKQLDTLRADRERLDVELREARTRLADATANETHTEVNAELNRQVSQLVRDFDQDKQETFEKFQSTCEAHYERCRETFRCELSAQFHEERNRLVADFEAQLSNARLQIEAERVEVARVKAAVERLGLGHTAALAALETRLRDEAGRELCAALERCENSLKATHAADCDTLRQRLDAAAQDEIRQQVELRVALGKVHWLDEQKQLRQFAIETSVNKTCAELEEQFEKQLEDQLDTRVAKLKPRLESELRQLLKNEYEETLLVERARLESELDARLAAAGRRAHRETGSVLVQTDSTDRHIDTADSCTNTEAADDLPIRERDRNGTANLKIRIGELERELAAFRSRDGELRSLAERYRRRAHELEQKLVEMRAEFDENAASRRTEFERTMKEHAHTLEQRRNEQRDALNKLEAECDARVRQVQDELLAERERQLVEHNRQVTELKEKYDELLDRFAAPQPNATGLSGTNFRSMLSMSLNETSSTVTLLSVIREQETRIGSLENAALERDVREKQLETQLAHAHDLLTAAQNAKMHADAHYRDRISELKQRLAEKLATIANEKQMLVAERDQLRARLELGACEQRERAREVAERHARNVDTLRQEAQGDREALARTLAERFDADRRKLLDQFDAERRTLESQRDAERGKVEEIEAAQRRCKANEADRCVSLRSSFVQTDAGPNENVTTATSFALASSSSVVLELRSQYLEAISKIKREAIEHVNATVSRAARTLKTEIVRDRRNTITRLKRALVEQSASSEKHLTVGTNENAAPMNADSAEIIRLFDQAVAKWAINASSRSLNVSERDRDDALTATSRPLNASHAMPIR